MNIVVLGDGLLGSEIVSQTGWNYISRKKDGFDITKPDDFEKYFTETFEGVTSKVKYDTIINCIANTDTYSENKEEHWKVNYEGVVNLTDFCNKWGIKLIYISTDHVYANSKSLASENDVPVHLGTWYGYTKLLADAYVQLKLKNYLVIRESHKPYPFPYEKAWFNQITNGDYVNKITEIIIKLIHIKTQGVYNIGTEIKTWYQLAKNEFPVIPISKNEFSPYDISMDLNKLNKILSNEN